MKNVDATSVVAFQVYSEMPMEKAAKLRAHLKQLDPQLRISIQEAEPEELFEKEYNQLNNLLDRVNHESSGEWGDAVSKKEVLRDVERLRKSSLRYANMFKRLVEITDALEVRAKSLKK